MVAAGASRGGRDGRAEVLAGRAVPDRPSTVLLGPAWEVLREARAAAGAVERHRAAHRAAVRGAVAAVGALADPVPGAPPQRAVWSVLAERAPELTEWAWFLSLVAPGSAAPRPERGVVAAVVERDADDLVRQVEQFLELLGRRLDRAPGRPAPAAAPRSA